MIPPSEAVEDFQLFDIHHGDVQVYVVAFSQDGQWAPSGGFESTCPLRKRGNRKSRRLRPPYPHVWRRSLARWPTRIDGGRRPTGATLKHGRARHFCLVDIVRVNGGMILSTTWAW